MQVTNTVERLFGGLQITKTVMDPDGGVLPGAQFGGLWTCSAGTDTFSDRFTVAAGATTVAFAPADQRVPANAVCSVIEDTRDANGLRDGSFAWGDPTYQPDDVTLVAGETATLGVTNTVVRVYADVTVNKSVVGPAAGLIAGDRAFTGTISCQYGTDDPIVTTWSATLVTPSLRAGVLVGSVCGATEDPPGAGGQPVPGDSSYIWLAPIVGAPVAVTPPDEPTPSIVVTNPTDRLFGTFDVTKLVTGATDGIVDPSQPYRMTWSCQPDTGAPISGVLDVAVSGTRRVGPEQQIPTGSRCTLTEPFDTMPALRDPGWSWADPVFVVDTVPQPPGGRTLSFTVPTPQENQPEPNVVINVTNNVDRTPGTFSIAKTVSSPPALNPDGTYTLAYDVDVTNTGLGSSTYSVTDSFAFAPGVAVSSVAAVNLIPGDVAVDPAFNGTTVTALASSPIGPGVTHRFRITVTANVAAAAGGSALDCSLDPGETGTGFLNRATVNPTAEACAPIPDIADLRVTKVVDMGAVVIQRNGLTPTRLTYTITATNLGPRPAVDAVVNDTLPPGVVFVSAAPSAGTCAPGATVTCQVGTVAVGASVRVIVMIDLPNSYPEGTVVNSAVVSASNSDPSGPNRSAAANTTVTAASGVLPPTGSELNKLILTGITLAAIGMGLLLGARRRHRPAAR